jgi:serine/threonine protein kinase
VKLATHKETRKKFAVKFMDISSALNHADEVNSLYKEANSIKKLRHKNIIELYHSFVEGKQMIMIMELASGGELTDYVQKKGRLDEIEARKILVQIISAIAYCHSSGVVHRDLKLENVLFLDDPEELSVKVIDFGISGVCTTFQNDKVDAGTVAYMPPEAFEGNLNTAPSLDVWAIGLMFYAMLYGTLPFYSQDEN